MIQKSLTCCRCCLCCETGYENEPARTQRSEPRTQTSRCLQQPLLVTCSLKLKVCRSQYRYLRDTIMHVQHHCVADLKMKKWKSKNGRGGSSSTRKNTRLLEQDHCLPVVQTLLSYLRYSNLAAHSYTLSAYAVYRIVSTLSSRCIYTLRQLDSVTPCFTPTPS